MTDVDLSRCAICGGDAQFTDKDPGANPVSYCARDLPAHMQTRAATGQMPLESGATKDALYEQAKELDIEGRSEMTKTQLETAVSAQHATARAAEEQRPTPEQVEAVLDAPPADGVPEPAPRKGRSKK